MIVLSTVKLPSDLKKKLENSDNEHHFYHDKRIKDVTDLLPHADIILTYGEDLTEEHIRAAKNLKWVMVASAGIEKLPFAELEKRKIAVTNAKGVHAIPMAEYCLAMMLQISRQTKALIENEKKHEWNRRVKMEELYGKTVFILGAGAIGSAIAKLSQAFGMRVLGLNQDGRDVEQFDKVYPIADLPLAIQTADFVISVLPSTEKTKGLIDYGTFIQMKNNSVFINIGRGDAVIEEDLIRALEEDLIRHAVLDVFDEEPLSEKHPFWEMDNVTITPHLSGITENYLPRAIQIFETNLELFSEGDVTNMKNIVSLQQRY